MDDSNTDNITLFRDVDLFKEYSTCLEKPLQRKTVLIPSCEVLARSTHVKNLFITPTHCQADWNEENHQIKPYDANNSKENLHIRIWGSTSST